MELKISLESINDGIEYKIVNCVVHTKKRAKVFKRGFTYGKKYIWYGYCNDKCEADFWDRKE